MTQKPQDWSVVPESTAAVARAALGLNHVYIKLRDELGVLYQDQDFATMFCASSGQSAVSPGQLALVTVMQFAEGLSDRQAAEHVCARIDWKYVLGLELTASGFDYSVLSEFRQRLLTSGREEQLLNRMLSQLQLKGYLKAKGRQRTDSTHVLAAIRQLNRLECVGETLRHTLNQLATVAPEWLLQQVSSDWFERYGTRLEQSRLPSSKGERQQLGLTIGVDGHHLLSALFGEDAPQWLRHIPAVEILRQVWVQQYYLEAQTVKWRSNEDLPPSKQLIVSPYDVQARYHTKRDIHWTGYTVHLTETCAPDTPSLITHVATTADKSDVEMTPSIHAALAAKQLLPTEHVVDTGYVSAEHLVTSDSEYGINLVAPVLPDTSWQAQAAQGFDERKFYD